ncbi:MAG: YeeE/YedE thiosulfate transporter family protein [Vicingaceae bacterium]
MNSIYDSWPWFVSGPAIALVLFLLLMMGKRFGMSSNLRTLCTICGAGKKVEFFKFDWKAQKWNLIVVAGVIIGGFLAENYLTIDTAVDVNNEVTKELKALGFSDTDAAYLPGKLYSIDALSSVKTWIILIIAGLLVGFGTRYAGGCTSGHAISGLSALQFPSLLAVIGFFAGGLFMVHVLFPLIF